MKTPKKTTADDARELYEHRHDPGEWEDEAEPIEVRPAPTAVVSVRLPRNEMDALEAAAAAAGESLSEFVRKAIGWRLGSMVLAPASVVNRSVGYPTFHIQTDEFRLWSRPSEEPTEPRETLIAAEPRGS
jgi:Ribbon-helix-helix protein, copG family